MGSPTGDEAKLRSLLLLSSSSAEHITDVCRTAEVVLQGLHSPAQARNFFSFFFPTLLQKVFGFQQQASSPSPSASSYCSKGWLSSVSSPHNTVAAKALISLLSPSGMLFTSLLKLDKQSSSLRFVFPTERLPDWVQPSLKGVSSSSQVPKLFTDRIKPNSSGASYVQLDIFEYFFFWFAYYAICKSDSSGSLPKEQPNKENSALKSQKKSFPNWVAGLHHHRPSFPNWAANLHHLSHQQNSNISPNVGPYLQLLQLYLAFFIPAFASSRASPSLGRRDYDRLCTSVATSVLSHTDFLVQTLTEFWLVHEGSNDAAAYVPPSLQLTESVRIFVNHMNKLSSSSYGWITSVTYLQILQRPLYRFFLRAFRTWAAGIPVEKAFGVVDVWLDFLQPWVLESNMDLSSGASAGSPCVYSERWQSFVSGNYLFYTNLTVYFLEFALKYMHYNLEAMLQMTSKILNVLAGSTDLLDHLRKLNILFNKKDAELIQKSSGVIAAIWDQLQRLEDVDKNWQKETSHTSSCIQLRLFSKEGNGGEAILELLILQAEGEIQMVSQTALKALEAIKKAGGIIFNITLPVTSPGVTPPPEVRHNTHSLHASRSLPQHTWMDVKYKGDWMRRPIESTEFAWLVRRLVQLSAIINTKLDLYLNSEVPQLEDPNDTVDQACNRETQNHLSVPHTVLDLNPTKVLDLMLWCVWSTLSILLNCIRGRGWRVNLRFLAKKPVALAILLLAVHLFRKLFIQVLSLF
eukprot:c5856_g1_i2 orf=56-2293(+)